MNLAEFWERENETGHSGPLGQPAVPTGDKTDSQNSEDWGERGVWEMRMPGQQSLPADSQITPSTPSRTFSQALQPPPLPPTTYFFGDPGRHFGFFMSVQHQPKFQSSLSLAHTRGVCLGLPGLLLVCFNSPLLDATADWELIGSRDLVSLWKVKTILFLNKQSHKI